jgi:hypothetical protein
MKAGQLKTLAAIFETPTRADIAFSDMERLAVALCGEVIERKGSRVIFSIAGGVWHAHRPHPAREAKKYQVESFRDFLQARGITP